MQYFFVVISQFLVDENVLYTYKSHSNNFFVKFVNIVLFIIISKIFVSCFVSFLFLVNSNPLFMIVYKPFQIIIVFHLTPSWIIYPMIMHINS